MPTPTETTLRRLRLALTALVLSAAWGPMARAEDAKVVVVDEEISRLLEKDLRVLTQILKTYVVTDLPATQALEQIWIQGTGSKAGAIACSWHSEHKHPEPKITLNLKDVPAQQVITYIAELSQSKWHLRGTHGGLSLDLQLEELVSADCSVPPVVVITAPLSSKGAEHLGINADMRSPAIVERLTFYGMKVTDKHHPAATYNADTGMLAVVAPRDEGSFVQALARLADRGHLKPAKP